MVDACPYCAGPCAAGDCVVVYTPITDCEHKDPVDGCCHHPRNMTPECHVDACPRLHRRIKSAPVAGAREVSPSCAGLAGRPCRTDSEAVSLAAQPTGPDAAKVSDQPTPPGASPDGTPCEICARPYAGPGVICPDCEDYAKTHR